MINPGYCVRGSNFDVPGGMLRGLCGKLLDDTVESGIECHVSMCVRDNRDEDFFSDGIGCDSLGLDWV